MNIRTLSAGQTTGVQRYAGEVLNALRGRLGAVASPPDSGGLSGHLWEQLVLPARLGGALLFSPANTGPLAVRRQVVTIHDLATLEHPEWFAPKFAAWYRWLLPRLARRARHVLTVSGASRERIVRLLNVPPDRVTAIPLAADERFHPVPEPGRAQVRHKFHLPERYVLAVGSLEPRKNLAGLFAAWQGWETRPPDLHLVVVGGQGRAFRDAGFGRLPAGVRLLGRVEDGDLPALYAAADVFAYPSLYEGFGLPPLEAMACGTPVVTSNVSSLPEVVGGAALLVDPAQPAALRAALQRLSRDAALREELRGRGLERSRLFSWQKTAEETWQVLGREAGR